MIPDNVRHQGITAAAGTLLAVASSWGTVSIVPQKRGLQPEGLHPPRGVAASGFRPLRKIPSCCLPYESGPYLSSSVADRPLRPATRNCLGEPLPHQQADGPRPHPEAPEPLLTSTCVMVRSSGINPGFPGLSRSSGQIGHVLRTRSPLRQTRPYGLRNASLDLHGLGAPPAFVLSQDQTLQRQSFDPAGRRSGDGGIRILSCVPTAGAP